MSSVKKKVRLSQVLSMISLILNVNFFNGFSHCAMMERSQMSCSTIHTSTMKRRIDNCFTVKTQDPPEMIT